MQWVMAAILICSLDVFSSCTKERLPEEHGDEYADPDETPVTDQLQVRIEGPTFVFDAAYQGEGKALVNRVTNPVGLFAENLRHVIIHSSQISTLTDEQVAAIIRCQASGGALIVADPTVHAQMELLQAIYNVATDYLAEESNGMDLLQNVDYLQVDFLLGQAAELNTQMTENPNFMQEINEDPSKDAFVSGIRGRQIFVSGHVRAEGEENTLNDYLYGIKADEVASWMNEPGTAQVQINSGSSQLQDLCKAVEYRMEKTFMFQFRHKKDLYDRYVQAIAYQQIWSAYSFDKSCDYYCTSSTVTVRNQNLNCGPKEETKWYDPEHWDLWKAKYKEVCTIEDSMYGPFMRRLDFADQWYPEGAANIQLLEYKPVNTGGQTTYSSGVNVTLGGNLGFNMQGPTGGVSGSVTFTDSRSRSVPDLKLTAESGDKYVSWKWDAEEALPKAHFRLIGKNYHETAKSILTSEVQIPMAHVLSIGNYTESKIRLSSTLEYEVNYMTYHSPHWEAEEFYLSDPRKLTESFYVPCPPRFQQWWALSLKADGISGDQRDKLMERLKSKLPPYCFDASLFFTRKPFHSEKDDQCDEIRSYLKSAFDAFCHNNKTIDIINEACKDFGIPAGGTLTFIWGQTNDPDNRSDTIEFVFKVS